jgi:uncharacterized paraquat-inducible protein A
MQGSISLLCPDCSARIKAPLQLIGQTRSCPRCGTDLHINLTTPEDAGPVLATDDGSTRPRRIFSDAF